MSGIVAIFHTDGAPVRRERLAAMAAAMDYRGPDGITLDLRGHVGLGHCAMRTRDAAHEVAQPLASDDGLHAITFDGYLLNGNDLRRDLAAHGAQLRGQSDAELVLHAYRQWGELCAAQLEGEFAFVIWDDVRQQLFCARDHQSMRPLHYHWSGTTLLVASDLAAIMAGLDEAPPLNPGYLAEQIANEWHTQDETPWRGICKLKPASFLTLSTDGKAPQVQTYWQIPLEVTIRYRSDEEYAEHYRAILDEAVCGAATSDRPVGFDVSGGLDSSAVFCMADRALREGRLHAPGLHGVALCGAAGSQSDESRYFRAVGEHTGREIAEMPLFEPELEWFHQQGQQDFGPPFAPNAAMMLTVYQEMASAGCRVALTGHGGDKWLNGTMAGYRQAMRARDWPAVAAQFDADRASGGLAKALLLQLRHGIGGLAPDGIKQAWKAIRPERKQLMASNFWLTPDLQRELRERRARSRAELMQVPAENRFKQSKLSEPFALFANEIVNLLGAKCGVDYRHPMLSRRFIEFSARTPEHIRLRGGVRKYIHREAMSGIIPDLVMQRQSKAAFNSSFRRLHPEMRNYCSEQISSRSNNCVQPDAAMSLFTGELGTSTDKTPIWEAWAVFAYLSFLSHAGSGTGPFRPGNTTNRVSLG